MMAAVRSTARTGAARAASSVAARGADGVYLGFDCSTQGLKATAVQLVPGPESGAELRVVFSADVNYDRDLPQFKTSGGMHVGEGAVVTSPPLMWVSAMDQLLHKMKSTGFRFDQVKGVSGSGQQHGSVYLRTGAEATMRGVKPNTALAAQVASMFSVEESPIWADSSTTKQCQALEAALGGAQAVASLTGSRAYERFTGNQIAKIAAGKPDVWADTERVSLVSSFMAGLLVGDHAPIDYSDAGGMNLMDLRRAAWDDGALEATAPGLKARLGPIAPSHTVVGSIAPYFQDTYGFAPSCSVVAWSGDNPCSVAGLGLRLPGDVGVSMGTSDTMFGITSDPNPGLEGHLFRNPVDPGSYMAMLCYKNGSLTREEVRDRRCDGSWDEMGRVIGRSPPANNGYVGFFITQPEITPYIPTPGIYLYGPDGNLVTGDVPPEVEARAVVEGQFMSMRVHGASIGLTDPQRIIATGGASANPVITQILADVFGVPVFTTSQSDSASLGAALRAMHGCVCAEAGGDESKSETAAVSGSEALPVSFDELVGPALAATLKQVAAPSMDAHAAYTAALPAYRAAEASLLASVGATSSRL